MEGGGMKEPVIVALERSSFDGKICSVMYKESERGRLPSIVIDWECSKLRQDAIRMRAKALCKLIGGEYLEDLTWHCLSLQKMPCRCPKCVNT